MPWPAALTFAGDLHRLLRAYIEDIQIGGCDLQLQPVKSKAASLHGTEPGIGNVGKHSVEFLACFAGL